MNVKIIKTILFRDSNGNDLRLTLGKIEDMEAYWRFMGFRNNDDKGFRWRFVGRHIPGIYRSGEWFNGFPEDVTIPWVKSQGYEVVAITGHVTGSVYVAKGNETPCAPIEPAEPEAPKGNEPVPVKYVVDSGSRCNAVIFDSFNVASAKYQTLLNEGYPNPRLYKATEYGKDDKGNETYKLSELAINKGHAAVVMACALLCNSGKVIEATNLYRFVHNCCLREAKEAVDKIRFA